MPKSEKVPKQMQSVFDDIVALTDKFCKENLNEEYAQLAYKVTAALCRKRPSPLIQVHTNTWACGIIYALGFVNFLFDKNNEPYLSAADLCEGFGVSKSVGFTKSKAVRNALGMTQLDINWCLPSLMDNNPMAWMLSINSLVVDVRTMPREIQELAYQKGLIPYIPENNL
ncbi:hypothetical protein AUJ95_07710 [Candidatus Desantisbacteria bacterium CG2_30_40_21]|uniref:DUF6398 domain-containing protein n=5 Tax=unclassified Candidatus Desantisiibacteriota TaxID=3106372 RepID=A0A1J5E373_9BACT|nr:MAG: hypothetical protein AUJ95_07710 [Candidatus Desantisbacteria bacterium CG2_30_40_21]